MTAEQADRIREARSADLRELLARLGAELMRRCDDRVRLALAGRTERSEDEA